MYVCMYVCIYIYIYIYSIPTKEIDDFVDAIKKDMHKFVSGTNLGRISREDKAPKGG